MPETAEKIFKQLNTNATSLETIESFGKLEVSTKVNTGEPLFMRIENK
jgi:methionyl-tRNA synthetase